jgi:D-alanyl-D-alanine carboxypeptidase (penicillin-binding protein 5/6)
MVVLDYTKDLDVFLTITQEDRDSATSYSSAYSLFEGGEKITIRDLLYASLLPSSNVANYVLARYVGQFLLETYNTNGFIPNN